MDQSDHLEADVSTPEREAATKKSTWISVVVNLFLTAFQVVAGFVSGSQGLIADGIHSLSDLIADFVVLIAVKHSSKEADQDHHYGHQRYENVASLILGSLLVAVGVGMAWSAIGKLESPETIPVVHVMALWVALGALMAKELLFRYMLSVAERVGSSLLVANAWHARSDAASSLVVALGILGNLMGIELLDPIAALIVGLMVAKMGWSFVSDAIHDLSDRAIPDELMQQIIDEIRNTPGVLGVHDIKSRKSGDMILLDVHLEIDGERTVRQSHEIAVAARKNVMRNFRVLNLMTHIDPV